MDERKFGPPLRGSVKKIDYSERARSWEELSRDEKILEIIRLMSKPNFVAKGGRASGEDALLLKLRKEPELVSAVVATPDGRLAVVSFITQLYLSEDGFSSERKAGEVLKLFSFEPTVEEQAQIHAARIDCIAEEISSNPFRTEDPWYDLTETDRTEVNKRVKYFNERRERRNERY